MFCFLSFALAHPFDAELYGHDLAVSFVNNTMEVVYHAEVPYPVVQEELRTFLEENRHVPLDALRTQYLTNRYKKLQEGLSLQSHCSNNNGKIVLCIVVIFDTIRLVILEQLLYPLIS